MKIRVEHILEGENEIILRCTELDTEMLEVLALLKDRTVKIAAQKDGEVVMLLPGQVFYTEAVDGRTFLYTENSVFETQMTLTQLELKYEETGLIRIGKSQLINLYHVEKFKNIANSRIEVTLKSKERMIVSRHYAQALKNKLGVSE
ncbi:LytTR family DNA-binding domain-containing protein [Bacillus atrophaeus]|uniref:LytTR family DNA-binding domain-containing protein n=1 Tax=Bacillus atrophaeus TaxID=1452 RepID=UPI002163612D|nr:LytTR family DNA-binding domain-containing protein [Bacillus atrophaeus]